MQSMKNNTKKVLIIANLAGFASFLVNDMDTLIDMGYSVDFAANGNKLDWEDTKEKLSHRSVAFHQIDFDSKHPFSVDNLKAFSQLRKLLKREKYGLVHCHTPIAGVLARAAAFKYRKSGTKVVYTSHGFAFTKDSKGRKDGLFRLAEKFCSLLTDAIITINNEDYAVAKSFFCPQVHYIHGVGVDTHKYVSVDIDRECYREKLGIKDNQTMILSVGELSHRKNHKVVIQAISRLSQPEKYVYVICGAGIDGGTGPMLQALARERNVKLILTGFRYDIPQITACADIGAIPSLREGLGLSGVQFLAAGLPVIGSDVQGIKDYVLSGKTGYLCCPESSDEFAAAIEKLADLSPEERKRFKETCQKVAKQFDAEVSMKEMKTVYKGILK